MTAPLRHSLPAFLFSIASLANVACGGPRGGWQGQPQGYGVVKSSLSRDTSPQVAPSDLQKLAQGNTTFALDLYHAITAGKESDDVFYSPYSVSIALAMTYAGAAGSTATQMAGALDFQLPQASLHPAFDALDLQLASRAHGQSVDGLQPFELKVVDSLWGDETFTFQKPFLDTLARYYGGALRTVDFVNAPDASRQTINGWVSDQTDALIPTLLGPGAITPDTRFVLANAIYFDAAWASPFDPQHTKAGAFTHLDGSTVQAQMMTHDVLETGYASGAGWAAVELPYAGNQTSMVVLLPDDGKFASVESVLDGAQVESIFASLKTTPVQVTLPKFTIQGATISLKNELSKLGMSDAFDPTKANFSALAAERIFISDVLHQAYVSVDENGTKAAAATGVIGVPTAVPQEPVTFDANRPFLFAIRDIPTNSVLFVGRVVDPK
jgi:serpin B